MKDSKKSRATDKCKSCGAPIFWAATTDKKTKRMPINPVASNTGNLAIDEPAPGVLVAVVADLFTPPGPRFTSHFATCPDAKEWRK